MNVVRSLSYEVSGLREDSQYTPLLSNSKAAGLKRQFLKLDGGGRGCTIELKAETRSAVIHSQGGENDD
jgi:hypothetical protein